MPREAEELVEELRAGRAWGVLGGRVASCSLILVGCLDDLVGSLGEAVAVRLAVLAVREGGARLAGDEG